MLRGQTPCLHEAPVQTFLYTVGTFNNNNIRESHTAQYLQNSNLEMLHNVLSVLPSPLVNWGPR